MDMFRGSGLALGLAFALSCGHAVAAPFSQVIVFGDSNVDSGYYKAFSDPGDGAQFNTDWPSGVAHGAGAPTSSPGMVSSQFLASFFGLMANPSNTAGGTNYATSGAKNVTANTTQTGGFKKAIPTVTQIANYLAAHGGTANSQALYYIYSGDNDVSYANQDSGAGPWPTDPDDYVTTAANDLANAVMSLKSAGAKHFVVAGLAYDYPGNDAAKRALKLLYTQTLWNKLTSLGIPFVRGDIDSVRLAISANPAKFGFTSIGTGAGQFACTQPSGVASAWALLCSSDPAAPSTLVAADAPETDLFADDQHLATKGQRLMAQYLYRLVIAPTDTHDFDGSGKSDILWRNGSTGATVGWLMNGGAVTQSSTISTVPTHWQIVAQRDFDGDGNADLLWRDTTTGAVALWLMNGLTVKQTFSLGTVASHWVIAGAGDFNGDGKADILWRDSNTGTVSIWLMDGGSVTQSGTVGTVAASWIVAATAADGKIIWFNSTTRTAVMWAMNKFAVAHSYTIGTAPANWAIAGTGDFDGSGSIDLLWRNSNGAAAMWFLSNGTVTSSASIGTVASAWSVDVTGDFDGNGKSDIVWTNSANGARVIWFMNGAAVASTASLGTIATGWHIQGMAAE